MATATMVSSRDGSAAHVRWRGDDFPAALSPMLVRELRQGMQSGLFFWTFLIFQAVLYVVFSTQLLSSSGDTDGPTMLFWGATAMAVAVIVPLRGLAAISSERVGNNIDLLMLTRLSATRVVLGKWIAIVAQSATISATLLPYCVLRYFFGGVDVLGEIEALGWIIALGAVFAAATIAVSTVPFGNIGGGILTALVLGFGMTLIDDGFVTWMWWLTPISKLGILAELAAYTIAFLEFAAGRIAPAAENHAARKRIFALGIASVWAAVAYSGNTAAAEATFAVTGPLLLCYVIGALLGWPSRVRALFLPFRRFGVAGRLAAMVLCPGWASGLVFSAVIAAVCVSSAAIVLARMNGPGERAGFVAFTSLIGAAIVFPLPATIRLSRQGHPMLIYFLLHLLSFCTFAFANAFKGDGIPWAEYEIGQWVTLPVPVGALCSLLAIHDSPPGPRLDASLAMSTAAGLTVIAVVFALVARPWLSELAAVARFLRDDDPRGLDRSGASLAVRRPAVARAWTWSGDDFPTWLPPMLVRELRQGVQSGVFAWTFIAIQATMFLLTAWAVGALDPNGRTGNSDGVTRLFWAAIGVAIVGVIPLRGLTAVSGERVGNNLDLVRLSRMSATQIILGKWFAIIGQGLLVASALLPYLVVRYFLGGVNVIRDLETFGWLAIASVAVAAAALALSTWSVVMRCMIGAAAFFGFSPLLQGVMYLMYTRSYSGSSRSSDSFWLAGVGIAAIAIYTGAFLEFAAARIAPPAENHALRKRVMALGIAAAWAVVGLVGAQEAFLVTVFITLPLLVTLAVESLLEEPNSITTLFRPFAKRGTAGRLAAMIFTPGWATGVAFVCLTAAVCMIGWVAWFASQSHGDLQRHALGIVGFTVGCQVLAILLFPLPFLVWIPRARPRFLLYAVAQFLCFMVFVYLASMAPLSATDDWAGWILALPFPAAALPAFLRFGDPDTLSSTTVVFAVAAVGTIAAVLAAVCPLWFGEMQQIQRMITKNDRRIEGLLHEPS